MPYDAVSIDTQTIITNDFRFKNNPLLLLKMISKGYKILLTQVVLAETVDRLTQKITDTRSKLKSIGEFGEQVGLFDDHQMPDITEVESKKLSIKYIINFLREVDASAVTNDHAKLSIIWDQYYTNKAPFHAGKKKSEFPDAIAINSLENFAESKGWRILVISGDKDWINYGNYSHRIDVVTDISSALRSLSEDKPQILASEVERFMKNIHTSGCFDVLKDHISNELEGGFYPADVGSEWAYDAEVDFDEISNIDCSGDHFANSIRIIQADQNTIKAMVFVSVNISFNGQFYFYSIDNEGDNIPRGSAYSYKVDELELELILEFEYNQEKSKIVSLKDAEVVSGYEGHEVSFGYLSPELESPDESDVWSESN